GWRRSLRESLSSSRRSPAPCTRSRLPPATPPVASSRAGAARQPSGPCILRGVADARRSYGFGVRSAAASRLLSGHGRGGRAGSPCRERRARHRLVPAARIRERVGASVRARLSLVRLHSTWECPALPLGTQG